MTLHEEKEKHETSHEGDAMPTLDLSLDNGPGDTEDRPSEAEAPVDVACHDQVSGTYIGKHSSDLSSAWQFN